MRILEKKDFETYEFDVLEHFKNYEYKRVTIKVCGGIGCQSLKSLELLEKLKKVAKKKKLKFDIKEVGCLGFCSQGPVMIVEPKGIFYTKVTPDDAEDIIDAIKKNTVVDRLLYEEDGEKKIRREDIKFYNQQTKILLARIGEINPEIFEEYLESKGYDGLKKALSMKSDDIIKMISDSDLRGRGGAGFPTGTKWSILKQAISDNGEKYLVCNADQGDPGAFMDRCVLEGDPLSVIEGMTIAAYATGSTHGFVYVRAEYPFAVKRIEIALELARKYGYLGNNILNTDFSFDIEIKRGAGAFVCGEETALMNSIEGRRGMPNPRPPYPAQKGIWGKPTNINNVKTYASVPIILRNGAEWFKNMGKTLGGTAVLALTGKVVNSGLVEIPIGTTIRKIIFDIGGGIANGKKFKAVQTGGPSGGCIDESCLDLPLDYQSLNKAGAIMGSGGLIVMDEDDSMIEVAKFFLSFTQDESCGKCTPCREGTKRMLEILTKISEGKGKPQDLVVLQDLAQTIKNTALCGLGNTAPNPVLSTIRYFKNEYDDKINDIKEKKSKVYAITNLCKGCDKCTVVCPVHAITGKIRELHVIDKNKCIGCGACERECNFKAIYKENEVPKDCIINKKVTEIKIEKKSK